MSSLRDKDLRLVSFEHVQQCGCPAYHWPSFDEAFLAQSGQYLEYRYEDGEVWVVTRELHRVHAMRRAFKEEIPQEGWRLRDDCHCETHDVA